MKFIKRIQQRWIRGYLIYSVRRVEIIASENKRWEVTPEILGILTRLLSIYYPLLITEETILGLKRVRIKTQFENLKSLEIFCDEFISQTKAFGKGEENHRPRIESSIKDSIHDREVTVLSFLEVETAFQLFRALGSIVALSKRLDVYLKEIPTARRKILLNMLKEIILPAYTVIEQIYEVVNSEDEAD